MVLFFLYDFYAGRYCKTLNSVQRKVLEIVWMLQCSHGEQSIIFMFIIQKHNGIMSDIQHHHSNNAFRIISCRVQWLMFKRFLITKFKLTRHINTVWNASKSSHSLIKMSPPMLKFVGTAPKPHSMTEWAIY